MVDLFNFHYDQGDASPQHLRATVVTIGAVRLDPRRIAPARASCGFSRLDSVWKSRVSLDCNPLATPYVRYGVFIR